MKKTFALLLILTLSNSCSQVKKELTNSLWEQEGTEMPNILNFNSFWETFAFISIHIKINDPFN